MHAREFNEYVLHSFGLNVTLPETEVLNSLEVLCIDSILFISIHIYPTPPLGQDITQDQFFKRSLTGLNSEFSFS